MKENCLLYFCDGIGSVFDSQVVALLASIKESGFFNQIYLILGLKDESQKQDFYNKSNRYDIEVVFYRTYPNYPVFNYLNRKSIKTALDKVSLSGEKTVFHVRGEVTAWHLRKVLHKELHNRILTDIRGASIEEIEEFSSMNRILKQFKINNYRTALNNLSNGNSKSQNVLHKKNFNLPHRQAGLNLNTHIIPRISAVSNSLRDYLTDSFDIDPETVVITPCLAGQGFKFSESERVRIRKELNLNNEDKIVVFSSGGTAGWQNNDVLFMLAERGIKVLNLSKKTVAHKNIINKFVSYDLMPDYLCAADAAIIWREHSVVNKVASPVKFSEYICCGLPVISNSAVDQIKEFIQTKGCGLILDNLDEMDTEKLKALKLKDRKSISEKGIQNFGVETITKKYLKIYSSLNSI